MEAETDTSGAAMRLSGKVAVVTGGAGGIGRAIAIAFAQAGASVTILDVNEAAACETKCDPRAAGRVTARVCDVADRAAVFREVGAVSEQAGGLDILVNNAIHFHYAPLVDMPEDIVGRMLDIGLKGTFWCTQAATPHLIARGGGSVINLSSAAVFVAIGNAAVYSSIKGAIDAFTRQQAVELAPHGIRVNALAPGPVATPGTSTVIDEAGWKARRSRTPLGRVPSADEVAAAALYLASDEACTVAGVTLKIDGALTIAGP